MKKALVLFLICFFSIGCIFANGTTETGNDKYPSKNIDIIVPVAAGSPVDLHVRAIDNLTDFGTTTSITNMPGANQTIGITEGFNRKADGYTIISSAFAGLVMQPNTITTEYKLSDFRHIAAMNAPANTLIISNPKSDFKTWEDLKDALVKGERTVYFTAANAGAVAHLAFLSLLEQLGAKNAEFVSFNGLAEATTAVMGGHVDIAIVDIGYVTNYLKAGTLLNLLTLSDKRSYLLPDDRCSKEVGIEGMDQFAGFLWLAVKKDTPDDVVEYLKAKINATINSEAYHDFLRTQNEEVIEAVSEEELTARLQAASDTYGHIISTYLRK